MIHVDTHDLSAIRNRIIAMKENATKEIRVAAWRAQKRIRSQIASELAKIINQPKKVLIKATYSKIAKTGSSFTVHIRGEFAIAIKRFKPKHTKRGVIAKTGKKTVHKNSLTGAVQSADTGKIVFSNGFMGPKPGRSSIKLRGTPVRRVGRKRLPIQAIPAVNIVLTIYQNPEKLPQIISMAQTEFEKQVRERMRFLTLKQQKRLTWQRGA